MHRTFSQPEMLCYGCKTAAKTVSDHYFLVVALTQWIWHVPSFDAEWSWSMLFQLEWEQIKPWMIENMNGLYCT